MLLPLIRDCDHEARKLPPYTCWGAATGKLREDLDAQPELPALRLLEYLEGIEPARHAEAIQDLIAEHLRVTWRSGGRSYLEDYVDVFADRFDVLASAVRLPADLIEDEFIARHALPGGDAPGLEEYERRFPGRPDAMLPLRSRLIGDRYVRLQRLGRGVSGVVWQARDCRSDRLVAIKLLHPELVGQSEVVRCFAEEAKLMALLDDPRIVTLHEFVQEPGVPPYLVMGLVQGRPLNELVGDYHHPTVCWTRRERQALWGELLLAFEGVCGAVAHAHSRGVLHRDLKAGNVLIEPDGVPVLVDWGLATRAGTSAAQQSGLAIGTPEYMAPEQVSGRSDERSDVFGLGAILHEMLTGQPLRTWAGAARPINWRQIVVEEPTASVRNLNPRAPRDLVAIRDRALASDARDRYPGPRALLDALSSVQERTTWQGWRADLRRLLMRVFVPGSQRKRAQGQEHPRRPERAAGLGTINRRQSRRFGG